MPSTSVLYHIISQDPDLNMGRVKPYVHQGILALMSKGGATLARLLGILFCHLVSNLHVYV